MFKKLAMLIFMLLIWTIISATSYGFGAEILQRTDFTDGLNFPWRLLENESNYAYSYVENNNFVTHMDNKGFNRWDIQVVHNDLSIYEGRTYTVEFKLTATKDCKIYAKIGDRADPYYEDWNNNWSPFAVKADKPLEVSATFNAKRTSKDVQFCFYLGGELAGSLPYDIKFSSMSLIDGGIDPIMSPTPIVTPLPDIRVNQLGYYPDSVKKATIKTDLDSALDWQLKNNEGEVVATGKTQGFGLDHASGEKVQIIDFSSYSTPGTGYKLVADNAFSLPFNIGNDIYSKLKYDALKYLYYARSGIEIKMPYCVQSQWARAASHTTDLAVLIQGRNYQGPNTLNATGGWYDGGDSSKHVCYEGSALWKIQNQYELAKVTGKDNVFGDNTMNIPESGNGIPDILDESRWAMEWMLNLQIPSGYDRAGMEPYLIADNESALLSLQPDLGRIQRVYYPPSTQSTLTLASCAAQAARLWKSIDPAFAQKCLVSAEIAWDAALKNPEIYQPVSQISTASLSCNYLKDEFYWAACELYITTGKNVYLDYIKNSNHFCEIPLELTDLGNEGFEGSIDRSTTAGLGTISLALNKGAEFPKAIENITKAADLYLSDQTKHGYSAPLSEKSYISAINGFFGEVSGYPYESNLLGSNNTIIMAYAYSLTGDKKYSNGVDEFMDYLLGRNPLVKSYITGYGANPVENPNHKLFAYQDDHSLPKAPAGFLVSGPSAELNSIRHWAIDNPYHMPAQKSYDDYYYDWVTNEVNVDINASLAWLAAFAETKGLIPINIETPVKTFAEDINSDGLVNMSDIMIIALSFNTTKDDETFNEKCDMNYDGVINMADVIAVAKKFGCIAK
ncbi:MAG: glycoside hydrolase family 9 protein [Bacillota bacterium]|nr:glycoside hydrolase family 9 protein [Bacillota bacterium]